MEKHPFGACGYFRFSVADSWRLGPSSPRGPLNPTQSLTMVGAVNYTKSAPQCVRSMLLSSVTTKYGLAPRF